MILIGIGRYSRELYASDKIVYNTITLISIITLPKGVKIVTRSFFFNPKRDMLLGPVWILAALNLLTVTCIQIGEYTRFFSQLTNHIFNH